MKTFTYKSIEKGASADPVIVGGSDYCSLLKFANTLLDMLVKYQDQIDLNTQKGENE